MTITPGLLVGSVLLVGRMSTPTLAPSTAPCMPNNVARTLTCRVELSESVRLAPDKAAVLAFEGVEVPVAHPFLVRVFANLPDATAETAASHPAYLGYFAMEAAPASSTPRRVNLHLAAPDKLPRLVTARTPLRVTLVPVTREGRSLDVSLHVDRVQVRE